MDERIGIYKLKWKSPICQQSITRGLPLGILLAEDGKFLFKESGKVLVKE